LVRERSREMRRIDSDCATPVGWETGDSRMLAKDGVEKSLLCAVVTVAGQHGHLVAGGERCFPAPSSAIRSLMFIMQW
jgi:hypothetical protein